jgi:uroporphyrinogen decarboxylase
MAIRNMQEWKHHLMHQEIKQAMPIMTHPGIEMIGKRVIDAVKDGEIQFRAIKAIADTYPVAASTMMMDLTVEAEAFGSTVNFSDHEVPSVTGRLVTNYESVSRLKVPSLQKGRIPEYLKAARLAAGAITDRPVFGGCIGPFSLAGRLFDMTEIMTELFMVPETIEALLAKCSAFLLSYIREMKKIGLNGVIMAEPAAGLLDEPLCNRFSSAFVKRIADEVQEDHFLFILHNCGNHGHVTRSMISTGAGGLHFGNSMDMNRALQEVPADTLVFGNIDPVGLFKMAQPAEMLRKTTALLEMAADHPNFVLSSGCDTPPGVPEENILSFFEAITNHSMSML